MDETVKDTLKHDKNDIVYNVTTTGKSKAIKDSNYDYENLRVYHKGNHLLLDFDLYEDND